MIKRVKLKRIAGRDGVPAFLVKGCTDLLSPVLCYIFNLLPLSGMFPTSCKCSVVMPVLRGGESHVAYNFHPVSLLCCLSRIPESIIHEHLYPYTQKKVSSPQHGFMKGRSTEMNLCTLLEFVTSGVHNHGQMDTVYAGMHKAFDKMNHALLLPKLRLYSSDLSITSSPKAINYNITERSELLMP